MKDDSEFISDLNSIRLESIDNWVWKEICLQNQTNERFDSEDTVQDMLTKNHVLKELFFLGAC